MKLSLFTASLLLSSTLFASQTTETSAKTEGLQAIQLLGKTLKSQLKETLQLDSNGTAAITFCTSEAQAITKKINAELPSHIKVRRTSLQLRSPENQADRLDIKIMKRYKKSFEKKSDAALMITQVDRKEFTRIYKPLVVGTVCLKCHGTNVSPEITASIQAAYPQDAAIGMKEGDFRGVIVAEIKKQY